MTLVNFRRLMKFIAAVAIWLVMASVLGVALVLAVKGNFWLLGFGLAGFIVAVGKIGCATH